MGDAFVCGEKEIALSLWDAAVAAAAAHQAVACCLRESWIFEFTTARSERREPLKTEGQ